MAALKKFFGHKIVRYMILAGCFLASFLISSIIFDNWNKIKEALF